MNLMKLEKSKERIFVVTGSDRIIEHRIVEYVRDSFGRKEFAEEMSGVSGKAEKAVGSVGKGAWSREDNH
jgi:fructose-1,6-bisphosphatase/inositol monophosphatase family enzyme